MSLEARLTTLLDVALDSGVASAAAAVVVVDGTVAARSVRGTVATVDDDGAPIPAEGRTPVADGALFDLASVTKTYSAYTLLRVVESGVLGLDDPIAEHLPEYRDDPDRRSVTLRHLLTHTSGLPATWPGWRAPFEQALAALPDGAPPFRASPLPDRAPLRTDLARTTLTAPPGRHWEYACTGFNTAMLVAEAATGESWADLVSRETLVPLGLADTLYRPADAGRRDDVVSTEYQPELHRGVVRGDVHDESSWSLGGATANAGLFADVDDVARFGEVIRRGETEVTARWMWDDQLPAVTGRADPRGDGTGASLGLRVGETSWMGAPGGGSRGHTGFTGTSVQVDRDAGLTIVLLTNRVHPTRHGSGTTDLRRAVAELAFACR